MGIPRGIYGVLTLERFSLETGLLKQLIFLASFLRHQQPPAPIEIDLPFHDGVGRLATMGNDGNANNKKA